MYRVAILETRGERKGAHSVLVFCIGGGWQVGYQR